MKTISKLLALPLLFSYSYVLAQVETNFNNLIEIREQGQFTRPYKVQIDFELPSINIDSLLQVERRNLTISNNEKPFQLAVPVKVDLKFITGIQRVSLQHLLIIAI